MKTDRTNRGFALIEFQDRYGELCQIQKSSLAGEEAIWFGPKGRVEVLVPGRSWQPFPLPEGALVHSRMHLTQEGVRELLPILQHFAEHGELPTLPKTVTVTDPEDSNLGRVGVVDSEAELDGVEHWLVRYTDDKSKTAGKLDHRALWFRPEQLTEI